MAGETRDERRERKRAEAKGIEEFHEHLGIPSPLTRHRQAVFHFDRTDQINSLVAARDAGMEVVYEGIRLTPGHIAATARDEDVDVVGLSILSGSHLELVPEVLACLDAEGVSAPVIVGGIIPPADHQALRDAGVAAVYTPKDFELAAIMADIAGLAEKSRSDAG